MQGEGRGSWMIVRVYVTVQGTVVTQRAVKCRIALLQLQYQFAFFCALFCFGFVRLPL